MQQRTYFSSANTSEYGGLAQLGERFNGIEEVSGSIPLSSTISQDIPIWNLAILDGNETASIPLSRPVSRPLLTTKEGSVEKISAFIPK
jgi:hypothetical protein